MCLLNFIYTCNFCFIKKEYLSFKKKHFFRFPKICLNSIYVPKNVWNTYVWKLSVKEFGYSEAAGLYQFFPEKSAGSQVFLKHLC